MNKKIVSKINFKNPELDVAERSFLPVNDKNYKGMMDLVWKRIQEDKNSEFKYCADCHVVSETRSGSEHHKSCQNVFTSRQIKGTFTVVNK